MPAISSNNAEHYTWGERCDGWHLVKAANLSVIQERVPPGAAELRHYHERAEQFFFILSGLATIEVGGIPHRLGVHEGLHIPAGTVHRLSNDQEKDLVFVLISTPPSHGDRVNA